MLWIFPVDLYRLAINLVCFLIDWLSWSVSFLKLFLSPPAWWSRPLPSPHWRRKNPKSWHVTVLQLQTSPHSTKLRSRWQISSFLTCCATYFEDRNLDPDGARSRQVLAWKHRQVSACTCLPLLFFFFPFFLSCLNCLLSWDKNLIKHVKGRREKSWQEPNLRIVGN